MSEDEFDFAGHNPGELLTTDNSAQPFDYQARLHHKGYTKNSSPTPGELFKALATEYVPTVVVNLPPRVVESEQVVRRPSDLLIPFLFRFNVLASVVLYLPIIHFGWLGFAIPFDWLVSIVVFFLYCGSLGPCIFFIISLVGLFILFLIDRIYLVFLRLFWSHRASYER